MRRAGRDREVLKGDPERERDREVRDVLRHSATPAIVAPVTNSTHSLITPATAQPAPQWVSLIPTETGDG
jgi:hypothetical protein